MDLDDYGQPVWLSLNRNRRVNRGIDELLGLLKGIVADGDVSLHEISFLERWINANDEVAAEWPCNVILRRLNQIYADEVVDDEERYELRELLESIVGPAEGTYDDNPSTSLPLCRPAPDVIFDRNTFVLTGKFAWGTRRACQEEIKIRGGLCSETVTLATSYLIVGQGGSRDWLHTSMGTKILKAVEYKDRCSIAIISEEHWSRFLLSA